jgi:hydroxymethylbilane synthase
MVKLARIRIGTRKSALALAQAEEVRDRLVQACPHLAESGCIEIVSIVTSGDILIDGPLTEIGGKGLFTKEIEEALLEKRIDIAVHSMKDVQTILPEGLVVGCMLEREDPRDRLVGHGLRSLDDLPANATFGTSSLRRSAQLLMLRPDIKIVPLRGNVQTRLKKVENGEVTATMLAMAGLNRLKLWDVPGTTLPTNDFLPAIAQGALGIECRDNDSGILEALSPLADIETETAVLCERAFMSILDGSCRTPIAGYATVDNNLLHMRGLIIRPEGSAHHAIDLSGDIKDAEKLGETAGRELLAKAGKDFLKSLPDES